MVAYTIISFIIFYVDIVCVDCLLEEAFGIKKMGKPKIADHLLF